MIWLIGCKGMLGRELSIILEESGLPFSGTDSEVDITDMSALENFIKNKSFNWIINCAAYTAVDKAEDDTDLCNRINVLGAENISICSKKIGARFIHISTDYVFDGKGSVPYKEDDLTNPIGVYGLTKRKGEILVLENNPNSYIIRTAWLYGIYGNNFVKTMIKLMNEKNELKIVDDQRGSPTWAFDLALVISNLIQKSMSNVIFPFGIYHYTNEGNITWYNFACEIFSAGKEIGLINNECKLIPCTSMDYPAKVKRPAFSVLDKNKIKNIFDISIPDWKESLKEYLKLCAH